MRRHETNPIGEAAGGQVASKARPVPEGWHQAELTGLAGSTGSCALHSDGGMGWKHNARLIARICSPCAFRRQVPSVRQGLTRSGSAPAYARQPPPFPLPMQMACPALRAAGMGVFMQLARMGVFIRIGPPSAEVTIRGGGAATNLPSSFPPGLIASRAATGEECLFSCQGNPMPLFYPVPSAP